MPETLIEAVRASGLSLREIGRRAGVDPTNLSKWLRNPKRDITLTSAEMIARALGYSLELKKEKR